MRTAVVRWQLNIAELGDLDGYGALDEIDGTGLVVAPLYSLDRRAGDVVTLPVTPSAKDPRIAQGQPGRLWLLRARDDGRYDLVRVVPAD